MRTLRWTVGLLLVAAAGTVRAQAPDGKALYDKSCKMCHGADGTPSAAMTKMWPALAKFDAKYMEGRSTDSVVAVLTHGTKTMKPFKDKMTPEELAAVAKYVKELAEKSGSP